MEIKTEIVHRANMYINGAEDLVIKSQKENLLYRAKHNLTGVFDELQKINIDGEIFEKINYNKFNYHLSSFNKDTYNKSIYYKGVFYELAGFRSYTIAEIWSLYHCLKKIWPDVWVNCISTYDNDGIDLSEYVNLVSGYSISVKRKITLKELLIPYKEIEKKAQQNNLDSSEVLRIWIKDVSRYLNISERTYKSGKYNLNELILKRLHKKINYKSKNQHL